MFLSVGLTMMIGGKLFVYIFQLTFTTLWFVFGLNIKLIIDVRNSLLFIVIQIVASEYW